MVNLYNILFEHDNAGPTITLYHYSRRNTDSIVLDPKYVGGHGYTQRDILVSDVPRVFFYSSLDKVEPYVVDNKTLYSVEVSSSDIYNMSDDPDNLLDKFDRYHIGRPDIDSFLKHIKKIYKGVSYRSGGLSIVCWFDPIVVYKVKE